MEKTLRNFRLDILLYLLLGLDIALVNLSPRAATGAQPGFLWHLHGVVSILLALGCLAHIALHWQWFQAALSGKIKGRMPLIMNSLIAIMLLLATLSGHEANGFHNVTGFTALLGMTLHGLKHTRWMFLTARKLSGSPRALEQVSSSD